MGLPSIEKHYPAEKVERAPHLKADTAHGQVAVVLQHAQIFCHQGRRMHQAHGGLRVALLLGVFLCHVLEPGQPQVGRCLVTLGNSEDGVRKCQGQLVNATIFLLRMATFFFFFPKKFPPKSFAYTFRI